MADAGAEAPMADGDGDGLILTLEASSPVEAPFSMTLEAPIPVFHVFPYSYFMR